jgi:DNA-binding LytR/AlgR family response regulator
MRHKIPGNLHFSSLLDILNRSVIFSSADGTANSPSPHPVRRQVTMAPRRFLFFNISFWLVAAVVLFINSLPKSKSHIDVAYTRYIYLMMIAMLISAALTLIYNSSWFQASTRKLLWSVLISVLAALLMAVILNPILYLMLGHELNQVHLEILITGTLYFTLLFLLWSALYLQWVNRPAAGQPVKETGEHRRTFKVEKMGENRLLQDRDICCVIASGDYVELHTDSNSYLLKETLASIESQLDGERFKRIHRSTIVNADMIESVVRKAGGAFELTLQGGNTVQSSRSYKVAVESILPKA